MGIYPDEGWEYRRDGFATQTFHVPGLTRITVFEQIAQFEFRDNCYCCSCGYDPWYSNDPYCRNHGYRGTRRCEVHDMTGDEFELGMDEAPTTIPLLTVQQENARQDSLRSTT